MVFTGGVAPPNFRGTELFFAPDLWAPMVNSPQLRDWDSLDERGNHSDWVVGHLKPGITAAAATADVNTIAASLAKGYPKSDDGLKFTLSRPGLVGIPWAGPPRAFMAGLMLLAGSHSARRVRQHRQSVRCSGQGPATAEAAADAPLKHDSPLHVFGPDSMKLPGAEHRLVVVRAL